MQPVASVLPDIAFRLNAFATKLGDAAALRERRHMEPATVAALRTAYPLRKVEKDRKTTIPSWSPVGNIDVLVHPSSSDELLIAIELKWCYVDKLYEAIWDLFKMALLATTGAQAYLITGRRPVACG